MERGTSSYAPLTRRRLPRRPHLFKTARLNAVGWAALFGAVLVVALIVLGVALLMGSELWVALVLAVVGGLCVVGVLLILDRRKNANHYTNFSWTDDEDEKSRACAVLNEVGVNAELNSWNNEPPFSLKLQNRDVKRASQILLEHGFAWPFSPR